MSLIIKGMKMPKYRDVFGDERGCVYLLMLTVNKDGTASMQFNDVEGGFYQVKEISTPHGQLIDDYKLLRALIKAFPNQSMNFYDTLERVIDEAPTIIEAEVSE